MLYHFISTFGASVSWIKDAIPIEVGAAVRQTSSFNYSLLDDSGNNISSSNAYWGELTGLYWIWKNREFLSSDVVGFAHYNKVLDIKRSDVEKYFDEENGTWIVRDPVRMVRHDYPKDIIVLEDVLKTKYPESYIAWERIFDHEGASQSKQENCVNCEMFFTTASEFDNYCRFIFDVLFEVKRRIGEVDRPPYHKRYLAFLGERLLSVYLMQKGENAKHVLISDKANFVVSSLRRLSRTLGLRRDSRIVTLMRALVKKKNRQSSYR